MSRLRKSFSRAFRTVPEVAKEQTGVAITSLLFALVISQLAINLAEQLAPVIVDVARQGRSADGQELGDFVGDPLSWSRARDVWSSQSVAIVHLLVAMTLTVTSAIGYYTSRNLPRLGVRFFNRAFFQFMLDTFMVFVYFLAIRVAEPHNSFADARPETTLVSVSFVLYVVWDLLSYWASLNPLDQVAMQRRHRESIDYGWRRHVTIWCTGVAIVLTLVAYWTASSSSTALVLSIDIALIALLIAYRLLKTLGDRNIDVRGEPSDKLPTRHRSKPVRVVSRIELEQVLPREVFTRLDVAVAISKMPNQTLVLGPNSSVRDLERQIEFLEGSGIVRCRIVRDSPQSDVESVSFTTELYLTDFGRYVCDAYSNG